MSRRRSKGLDWEALIRAAAALGILFGGASMVNGAKTVPDVVFGVFWIVVVAVFLAFLAMILVNAFTSKVTPPLSNGTGATKPQASRFLRFIAPIAAGAGHRPSPPTGFTWALLKDLEWRSFEKLVTGYFRLIGFEAERLRAGADGGVDIVIRKAGEQQIFAYVQCKAWNAYLVGVKPVRELFGVMAANGVSKGYFVATGTFTPEATAFGKDKPLKLVAGAELLQKLNELDSRARENLFNEVTAGDYATPTCPSCDEKMVSRKGKDGAPFWGCRNFPKCWKNFPLRKAEK